MVELVKRKEFGKLEYWSVVDADQDADIDLDVTFPAGMGNFYLRSVSFVFASGTTVVERDANDSLQVGVKSISTAAIESLRDVVGVRMHRGINVKSMVAHHEYLRPVPMEEGDMLEVRYVEIDTNGAPTGDLYVFATVTRM